MLSDNMMFRIFAVIGSILLMIGVPVLLFVPSFISRTFKQMDYLGKDSNGTLNEITQSWQKPKYDMGVSFTVYNVENELLIFSSGAQPILKEIGPFHFDEHMVKKNLKWLENDTKVEYENVRYYNFNQDKSCTNCTLEDVVTIPSVVYQKILEYANHRGLRSIVEMVFNAKGITPFIKVKVGEALFDGYKDPILQAVCESTLLSKVCSLFKIDEKIGFYYQKNGTADGVYQIDTGYGNRDDISKIYAWNHMLGKLNDTFWWGDEARRIYETDGQMFPSDVDQNKRINMFTGQACRTLFFDFARKSEHEGVSAFIYNPSKSMMDMNVQKRMGFCNPDTPRYFNSTSVQLDGCPPNGLMDVSSCVPGAPKVFISQPHFLNAPEEVRKVFAGIKEPSESEDNTLLEIEPDTGVLIHAEARTQMNLGMDNSVFSFTSKQPNLVFPIFYVKESINFDKETRDKLHHGINFFKSWAYIISIALIFMGAVTWTFAICSYYKAQDQLLRNEEAVSLSQFS
uniref:CD36 family protein n=1 Tax=Rhabditophanes sp. KR3021 TaxID=114890 RepID=A0AC35TZN0_9BILA